MQVPDEDDTPWFGSGAAFYSFAIYCTIPLLAYAVFHDTRLYVHKQFIMACVLRGCAGAGRVGPSRASPSRFGGRRASR